MHKVNCWAHNWTILSAFNKLTVRAAKNLTGTVVDLGCGNRPYEADILVYADKYIGVDWTNTFHSMSADIVADLNSDIPLGNECADAVVSYQVMEHLYDPLNMLSEAYRILRPGGVIHVSVPFQWHVHEAPYDYYRYTRYGLRFMFRSIGFEELKIYPATGFWVMWTLKLNYQLKRLVRGPSLFRTILGFFIGCFFLLNQSLAILLDKVWPDSSAETAGYFIEAVKKYQPAE